MASVKLAGTQLVKKIPHQNSVKVSFFPPHTYDLPHTFHSFGLDLLNSMWQGMQIMGLPVMQFSPPSCYIFTLWSTHLLRHSFIFILRTRNKNDSSYRFWPEEYFG